MNIIKRIAKQIDRKNSSSTENNIGIKNKNGIVENSGNITNNTDCIFLNLLVETPNLTDYEQSIDVEKKRLDATTICNLFTNFSTELMDDFFRNEPIDIDCRVVLIKDYWDNIINSSAFILYDTETNKIIRAFYDVFSKIIHDGSLHYAPHEFNVSLYRFFGYENDRFISSERQEIFNTFRTRIGQLFPLYQNMINRIQRTYCIDFKRLSDEFIMLNNINS